MNDRELLELAAKAAGYVITGWNNRNSTPVAVLSDGSYWQPLLKNQITDTDGDALRLAVALRMDLNINDGECDAFTPDSFYNGRGEDTLETTRRAIVRAAAEIGKSM